MSPRRGDRAAPPPTDDEYTLRFVTNDAAAGWEILCRQAPGNTRQAWLAITATPRPLPPTHRHHRLKLDLASAKHKGRVLDQWQYEVTGAGRVWYLVDELRTCWITHAGPRHPKATE